MDNVKFVTKAVITRVSGQSQQATDTCGPGKSEEKREQVK
jgi:hypothetical protein